MESKITLHFLVCFTFFLPQITLFSQGANTTDCQGLSIDAEVIPACTSGSNGHLNLVIEQGMPPYRVTWEDGSSLVSRKVPAGNYHIKITDALGCLGAGTFTVSTYTPIQASAQVKHTSKSGKSNGDIFLNVSGGAPPYRYTWVSSTEGILHAAVEDLNQIKKIPSGFYQMLVFDSAGCYSEVETEVR